MKMIRFTSLCVLLIISSTIDVTAVPFSINPNCSLPDCQKFGSTAIFYAKKDLDQSSIHLIYSSIDQLTISIIETPLHVQPEINYEKLFSKNYTGAIVFKDAAPSNILSLVVRRVIEFNDLADTGMMKDDDNTTLSYSINDTSTTNVTFPAGTTEDPTFQVPIPEINGTLTVDLVFPGQSIRDSKFPKLQVQSKSFFLNMAIESTGFHWKKTRFALELYIYGVAPEHPTVTESRFIDDQYTPGIFNVFQLQSTSPLYTSSMLWKPVVYLTSDRSIEANTLMQVYPIKNSVELDPNIDHGLVDALFNKKYFSAINISLGEANDGFYTKNNYSFVQFTAGLDNLQQDSTKIFVSVALIVSLALPALVGLIALIFIAKRRCTTVTNDDYDPIS